MHNVKIFSRFLFPPLCLHCDEEIEEEKNLFCPLCLEMLALKDFEFFCIKCFSPVSEKDLHCKICDGSIFFFSAFELLGSAVSFHKALKFGKFPNLLNVAASYMVLQYGKTNFPLPDHIFTIPSEHHGYDLQKKLGASFASILEKPILNVVKRKKTSFLTSSLTWKKPLKEKESISLLVLDTAGKENQDLKDIEKLFSPLKGKFLVLSLFHKM